MDVDIGALNNLKLMMEKLKTQRSEAKGQLDEIEQHAVSKLMEMGVRFVDESGTGQGPYWTLCKEKNDGSFSKERYRDFFSQLLKELQSGKQYTPDDCTQLAQNYLKQFEKRRLVLNKLSQSRQSGVEDLRQWLAEIKQ
jgi:polyhydroxyalkanoate synthesis regulator phasin